MTVGDSKCLALETKWEAVKRRINAPTLHPSSVAHIKPRVAGQLGPGSVPSLPGLQPDRLVPSRLLRRQRTWCVQVQARLQTRLDC